MGIDATSAISIAKRLFVTMATATVVGGYMSSSAAEPVYSNPPVLSVREDTAETNLLVRQIHEGINEYRAERNLLPLSLNTQISKQAKIHSQNMAQQVVKFSHQGFEGRINALEGDIAYRRAAENVAYNQGYRNPAQRAIAGWLESEGHHENLVGDFNLTGIGVAKNEQGEYYFTQIFIKE